MFTIINRQLYITELKNNSVIDTLIEINNRPSDVYVDNNYVNELLSSCLLMYFGHHDVFLSYEHYEYYKQHISHDNTSFCFSYVKLHNPYDTTKLVKAKTLSTTYDLNSAEREMYSCCDDVNSYIKLYNLVKGLKKGYKEHIVTFFDFPHVVKSLLHYGKDYLSNINNISYKAKLMKLNHVLCKYDSFFFNPNNVETLEKQLIVLDIYDKNYEQYGEYLVDTNVNFETLLDTAKLKAIVANIYRTKNRFLAKPLDNLPNMSGGWEVKQLNTVLDLIEEGQYQHNCIGSSSYAHRVKSGRGIAISLRKDKKRHTIFFHLSGNKWRIEQDLSFANKRKEKVCDEYNVKLIDYNMQLLLEHLNKNNRKQRVEELF